MAGIYVVMGVLALFIGGSVWARAREKKEWNGGICRETGTRWELFDINSQGGRGYVTRTGERKVTWISWPGVDRNYRPGGGER